VEELLWVSKARQIIKDLNLFFHFNVKNKEHEEVEKTFMRLMLIAICEIEIVRKVENVLISLRLTLKSIFLQLSLLS
jgi:hypothetical protein